MNGGEGRNSCPEDLKVGHTRTRGSTSPAESGGLQENEVSRTGVRTRRRGRTDPTRRCRLTQSGSESREGRRSGRGRVAVRRVSTDEAVAAVPPDGRPVRRRPGALVGRPETRQTVCPAREVTPPRTSYVPTDQSIPSTTHSDEYRWTPRLPREGRVDVPRGTTVLRRYFGTLGTGSGEGLGRVSLYTHNPVPDWVSSPDGHHGTRPSFVIESCTHTQVRVPTLREYISYSSSRIPVS